ncbi:hypothetical protein SRHO_G00077680 [Serrasalmus rhombeus]
MSQYHDVLEAPNRSFKRQKVHCDQFERSCPILEPPEGCGRSGAGPIEAAELDPKRQACTTSTLSSWNPGTSIPSSSSGTTAAPTG